jgi:hypothetical protein
MFEEIKLKSKYSISLVLSTAKRKTCPSLGEVWDTSADSMLRILEHQATTSQELLDLAKRFFGEKPLFLIIDDSLIKKTYSKFIEGTSDNYDSADRKQYRSLCSIVAMLSDGTFALPIDQKIWTSEEFAVAYKKKTELAQQLIEEIKQEIRIKCVVMDGLYATTDMIDWCIKNKVPFECRFHSNRAIITNREGRVSLKKCRQLKLTGSRQARTIVAHWKGFSLHITSVRRINRHGVYSIVYQVSNYKTSALGHARVYDCRWQIEKFFRTAKQHLGLADCQSRKLSLQINHIKNVFLTYHILQWECRDHKLKSPEMALKQLKSKNPESFLLALARPRQIFHDS